MVRAKTARGRSATSSLNGVGWAKAHSVPTHRTERLRVRRAHAEKCCRDMTRGHGAALYARREFLHVRAFAHPTVRSEST
jgi:hypothetical protein